MGAWNSKDVLVIDDGSLLAETITNSLQPRGYFVLVLDDVPSSGYVQQDWLPGFLVSGPKTVRGENTFPYVRSIRALPGGEEVIVFFVGDRNISPQTESNSVDQFLSIGAEVIDWMHTDAIYNRIRFIEGKRGSLGPSAQANLPDGYLDLDELIVFRGMRDPIKLGALKPRWSAISSLEDMNLFLAMS